MSRTTFSPLDLPLVPPSPERCLPPVHVDRSGQAVPDPRALLGLPADGPLDPAGVQEAYREQLLEHPPEADPRGARQLREARDRLLDPDRFLERTLGILHVPDPDAWDLPRPGYADPSSPSDPQGQLTPEARLLGQAALYTLVEEALWNEGIREVVEDTLAALRGADPGSDRS